MFRVSPCWRSALCVHCVDTGRGLAGFATTVVLSRTKFYGLVGLPQEFCPMRVRTGSHGAGF